MPDTPIDKARRDLDGVHVLLVEDSDDSREVLQLTLQYCGALVTSVSTATEAERLLRELRPHVLVTDINMPDDGLALVRAARAAGGAHGTHAPTIAITAARGRRAELLAEGLVEVLEKPLDPIELCRTFRRERGRRRLATRHAGTSGARCACATLGRVPAAAEILRLQPAADIHDLGWRSPARAARCHVTGRQTESDDALAGQLRMWLD